MTAKIRKLVAALAAGLIVVVGAVPVSAKELLIKEEFFAGSSGHQLTVRVKNLSESQKLEGVSVSLVGKPDFVTVDAIRPGVRSLEPQEVVNFAVVFSVAESAPEGAGGALTVQVTATSDVAFDVTTPKLLMTVRRPDHAEGARDRIAACDFSAALVLIRKLPEDDPRREALKAELDEALLAHDRAETSLRAATSRMAAGDFDGADEALARAADSPCPAIQDQVAALGPQIAEARDNASEGDLASARAALESCDFAVMREARDTLAALPSPSDAAQALLARLDQQIVADEAYQAAGPAYHAGDLDGAVERLNAAQVTSCPARLEAIAERLDKIERLRGALARVEAILESCDIGKMQALAGKLEGRKHSLLVQAKARVDAALGSLSTATRENESSKPAYVAGQLGKSQGHLQAASAALDGIGAGACPKLRSTIAGRLDKIQRLRTLLAQAERAKQACDRDAMQAFIAKAEGQGHRLITAKVQELRAALESCAEEPPVAEEGPAPEPEPDDETESYIAATQRCQAEFGDQAYAAQKGGAYHCLCDQSGRPCRPQTAAQPAAQPNDDGGQSGGSGASGGGQSDPRITGQMVCAAAYEGGILLGTTASGSFRCGCPSDRYLDEGRGACLTWNQVVAAADQSCRREGGTLAQVSGPGQFSCCPASAPRYDEQTDSCWGRDDMVADAQAQCGRQGMVAAQINGPNDYVCCPRGTTRYDAASNRCIDENQARRDAQQAAQALQGLGQALQGLSQPGGGSAGGGYSCANPPPGCHCRPGTTQFHCGNEFGGGAGGTTNNACERFRGEANQHAARMQRIMQQYQALGRSKNTSRAALQAKACEMFREGRRGDQIISRARSAGCPIPPEVTRSQGAFTQAIAESC